jgi:hypothetical protein
MSKRPKETERISERLKKIVESFPNVTVTVLGDLLADEFIFGEISRVSREAPVLILKHRERTVPGGLLTRSAIWRTWASMFSQSAWSAMTNPGARSSKLSATSMFPWSAC